MPIDASVVQPRVPRLGTITAGRGVAATSSKGNAYARPQREATLVLHTNDPELATAVQTEWGGNIHQDSPSWGFDVVTDVAELRVSTLVSLFRQDLCVFSRSQTLRRCDGVRQRVADGRPVDQPCACALEMARGADRACTPTTVLPVLLDLPVDRVGTWEVRSTSWGTAANLAGTLRLLQATGYSGEVPAILAMRMRTLRDKTDQVRDVPELHLTPAVSLRALGAGDVHALPVGPEPEDQPAVSDDDRVLEALTESWDVLFERASRLDVLPDVRAWWRDRWGGRAPHDLGVADMRDAVDGLRTIVTDTEERLSLPTPDDDRDAGPSTPVVPSEAQEPVQAV